MWSSRYLLSRCGIKVQIIRKVFSIDIPVQTNISIHTVSRILFLALLAAVTAIGLLACEAAPDDVDNAGGDAAPDDSAPLDTLFSSYDAAILNPPPGPGKDAAGWVDSTLSAMTLDEKIGQLFIVELPGTRGANMNNQTRRAIEDYRVGGFLMPRLLPPEDMAELTREMQNAAQIPLFVAADYERGVGRFNNPMTELPSNMAIGATRNETFAAAAGRLTALESRAVGINLLFAPVVDVNNNPDNPIINIRSYGGNPELVGRMGEAFVRAAERQGALTTIKHFPGHGDTSVDTHSEMATVTGSRAELDSMELRPYRMILDGEQAPAAVMAAHLWVQALEPDPLPATFSESILRGLLREEFGFEGLVVTDDIEMGALSDDYPFAERIIRALAAGVDVVLTPDDTQRAINAVRRAVEEGRLSESDIDASVRRILTAKAQVGLDRRRSPKLSQTDYFLAEPRGEFIANAIAERSITLLKNEEVLPLRPDEQQLALVQLSTYEGSESIDAAMDRLQRELGGSGLAFAARSDTDVSENRRQSILQQVEGADIVVLPAYLRLRAGRGEAGLYEGQSQLVEALIDGDVPVVLITFGNPYVVSTHGDAEVLLVAYDQTIASTQAAADVLLGRQPPHGKLPITVAPYEYGSGLQQL